MIPESNRVNILVIYLRIMKLMINGHITPPHLNEVMYTSEGCQSTDPQSCQMRPQVAYGKGGSIAMGRGLSGYNTETPIVVHNAFGVPRSLHAKRLFREKRGALQALQNTTCYVPLQLHTFSVVVKGHWPDRLAHSFPHFYIVLYVYIIELVFVLNIDEMLLTGS